jgi:TldD protein
MLHAKPFVSQSLPVVINNKFGGVILHEACVHSLEATGIAKNMSVFNGKLGQKIASDVVTAIDDGTLKNNWGSLNIDDEGRETQRNVLIENGVLKSYLYDFKNARRLPHPLTGSGRRESYKWSPTSRMNNTFIAPGKSSLKEIIANTKYGFFAKALGGGSVDVTTGEFNFSVQEGYMIREGKIAEPRRAATLVGTGKDLLFKIDMVGNELDYGQGVCGSLSGSVPTDVGQPPIRVSEMTVGGQGE